MRTFSTTRDRTPVITYLGTEKIAVGNDTLLCEHVRSELHWELDNIKDNPRKKGGTRTREYWFAPSIGYFVKIIDGKRISQLISYKLAD